MKSWRYTRFCFGAMVGLGASFGVAAQQSSSGTSASLEEIVVSAERREERLQDVPIAITNLSAQQLTDAGIQDLAAISKLTPALRIDNNGPFFQPTIRGVGSAIVSSGGGANVGIYIDGFYSPNPQSADAELLNVESIQVLKGPQGTLFGRNTSGGAILVSTTKPRQKTSAIVDASYGSFSAQRYQGYFTTGLSDRLAFDVAASFKKGDGFYTNIANGDNKVGQYENWQVRTGLKVDLSDKISVLLRYQHQKTDDPSSVFGNVWVANGQPLSSLAVTPGVIYATKPGEVSFNPKYIPDFTADNDIVQLTPTIDLNFATLTSYTQYRREKNDFSQNTFGSGMGVFAHVPIKDTTITQEFLLSSKPGTRLQWTVGAFYLDYTDLFNVTLSIFGAPPIPGPGSNTDTFSEAVFADATYQLSDKFYLTAGLRYSHDDLKDVYQIVFPTENHVKAPDVSGSRVIPRAVLRYAPDEHSSLYASFTRGYKATIYDLGGITLHAVSPESMSAYEVGYKYAAQALSANLATYYYKYTNLQVSSYSVSPSGVGIAQIQNAANARIYGIEGDVQYAILRDFQVNASAAYTNAKYTSWPNAPNYTPCFSSRAICGANYGTLITGTFDASGLEMQRAPKFTASLGPRYSTDVARGRLALSASLYYTSSFYFEPVRITQEGGYATLGVRGEWTDPSERYTFAVYGDNVTNKRYHTIGQSGNTGVFAGWSPPATVGAEIQAHFR